MAKIVKIEYGSKEFYELPPHIQVRAMADLAKDDAGGLSPYLKMYYDEAPPDVKKIIRGLAAEYLRNGMSMNDAMVGALHREDELYRLSLKNPEPDCEPDIDFPEPEYLEARVARHGRKKRKDTGSVGFLPELTENDEPDAEFDDPEPEMEDDA